MKSAAALCLLLASGSIFAQSLFDYSVYTKEGISASCGRFQGKIGSPETIVLRDVLVESVNNDCSLESKKVAHMSAGSLMGPSGGFSCAMARRLEEYAAGYTEVKKYSVDFSTRTLEMDYYSLKLRTFAVNPKVQKMFYSAKDLANNNPVKLAALPDQYLVIEVSGKVIDLTKKGLLLSGPLKSNQIIWNFFEAESVTISETGTKNGIPGIILAPMATVYFTNGTIHGGLYAKKMVGHGNDDCRQRASGGVLLSKIDKNLLDSLLK